MQLKDHSANRRKKVRRSRYATPFHACKIWIDRFDRVHRKDQNKALQCDECNASQCITLHSVTNAQNKIEWKGSDEMQRNNAKEQKFNRIAHIKLKVSFVKSYCTQLTNKEESRRTNVKTSERRRGHK
jgi:hypothetical protein